MNYATIFSKLRTASGRTHWTAETLYRAPNKPLLLLSLMDLIAQGVITSNFIEINADLEDVFDLYWIKVMGSSRPGNLALPFFHLRSDGFWHLSPAPGVQVPKTALSSVGSLGQLKRLILGAQLDEALFSELQQPQMRDHLRRVLIKTYFAPELRSKLVEIGQITAEMFEYSRELAARTRGRFKLKESPEVQLQYHVEARSAGFRRVVVDTYNHTCAICGIRVVTPEGRTAVAAAHIVPWSFSHNDDPRNGMALCGLHHWIFDQGLLAIDVEYKVRVSPVVAADDEATKPVVSLHNLVIHRPVLEAFWPSRSALQWHLDNIFRANNPPR